MGKSDGLRSQFQSVDSSPGPVTHVWFDLGRSIEVLSISASLFI